MTRTAIIIAALGVLSGAVIGSTHDQMWPFGIAVAGSAVAAAVFFYGIAAILNVLGAILLELWQQRQPLTAHQPQHQDQEH